MWLPAPFTSLLVPILVVGCIIAASLASPDVCNASAKDDLVALVRQNEEEEESPKDLLDLILSQAYGDINPRLPACLDDLKRRGSYRCWHKHSTFHDHLLGVYMILRLWGQDEPVALVGLFHSAYSNSYVNLALYDPATERDQMVALVGKDVEQTVYLFCSFNRQSVVVDTLLKNGRIPVEGLTVPHLRHTKETIHLNVDVLRTLVVFTMADIADQYFGWQDELFGGGGERGSMIIPGQDHALRHNVHALWPGPSQPGLWMSYVSELAQLVRQLDDESSRGDRPLPPVFDDCTRRLSLDDEIAARDLYWSVVQQTNVESANATLLQAHARNPFAFEPLVMLAQISLHANQFDLAELYCQKALTLIRQWGTPYDKRISLAATTAWTRVLLERAVTRSPWPDSAWEINNFGLVR
jgi:hypothetical protein